MERCVKLFVSFVKILLDLEKFNKKLSRRFFLLLLLVYSVYIYTNIDACVEKSGGTKLRKREILIFFWVYLILFHFISFFVRLIFLFVRLCRGINETRTDVMCTDLASCKHSLRWIINVACVECTKINVNADFCVCVCEFVCTAFARSCVCWMSAWSQSTSSFTMNRRCESKKGF